jgi:hypothetical protein
MNLKRRLAIGMTAVAAVAFAGGAFAATQDSGASGRQAFLNDVAKRLNVTPKQLSAALQGADLDQLQAAVAAGKLTQTQANAIRQRLQRSGAAPLGGWRWLGPAGGGRLFGPRGGSPGPPPSGVPGPGFRGFRLGLGPADALGAAAADLGISDMQLFDQLKSGKSIAQIAKDRGKTVAGLKDAVSAAVRSRLDKLVSAKLITAAQEQRILSDLSSRLEAEINAKGFGPRWGQRRPAPSGPALLTPAAGGASFSAD